MLSSCFDPKGKSGLPRSIWALKHHTFTLNTGWNSGQKHQVAEPVVVNWCVSSVCWLRGMRATNILKDLFVTKQTQSTVSHQDNVHLKRLLPSALTAWQKSIFITFNAESWDSQTSFVLSWWHHVMEQLQELYKKPHISSVCNLSCHQKEKQVKHHLKGTETLSEPEWALQMSSPEPPL